MSVLNLEIKEAVAKVTAKAQNCDELNADDMEILLLVSLLEEESTNGPS